MSSKNYVFTSNAEVSSLENYVGLNHNWKIDSLAIFLGVTTPSTTTTALLRRVLQISVVLSTSRHDSGLIWRRRWRRRRRRRRRRPAEFRNQDFCFDNEKIFFTSGLILPYDDVIVEQFWTFESKIKCDGSPTTVQVDGRGSNLGTSLVIGLYGGSGHRECCGSSHRS